MSFLVGEMACTNPILLMRWAAARLNSMQWGGLIIVERPKGRCSLTDDRGTEAKRLRPTY